MCMYVTTFAMHTKPQDEWHSVGVWEHSLWNLWNIHTTRRECIKKHVYVWASSKKTRDTKERRCEWSVEWHFNIQPERKINISCSKNNEHSRAWASHDAVAIHIHLSHSFISIYSPCPCFSPFRVPFPKYSPFLWSDGKQRYIWTVKNKNKIDNLFDLVSEKL